ncbi:MAG: M20 family metallopeptidase [Acidimicrobiia bacterium]
MNRSYYGHLKPCPDVVALRRHFHRHPELRFAEAGTAECIADFLRPMGFEVQTGVARTGVVASMQRGSGGYHVALRADMDALPIPDSKDVEYRSTVEDTSHACGHDAHVAIAMATAAELAAADDWEGRVTLVFQPAEEVPFGAKSGAREMIAAGLFDLVPPIDAMFGLHCWPWLDVGQVGAERGPAMAAKDAFQLCVTGKAAHVATPHEGVDAILVAARIVQAIHQLVSRRVAPGATAVVHVGTIEGGRSQSVLADDVRLTGTIRTHDEAVRSSLKAAVEAIAASEGAMWGATAVVTWANEMPSLINDRRLVDLARTVLIEPAPGAPEYVDIEDSPLTTDDFAVLAERVPALYMKLGVRGPVRGHLALHTSGFDIDEDALQIGIIALERLSRAVLDGALAGARRA